MRLQSWLESVARRRRRALSAADRRRRDELLVPLVVGRLEDRRVLNAAPVLSGANNLNNINANDTTNSGTRVSALIAGKATGAGGIAITFADTTNGSWQYTLNGGSTWNSFPTVSQSTALLLTTSNNTSVRFQPGTNYSGTDSPALTFQAWDGTTGTAGTTADASTNGGTTPFSSASASSAITVVPVITITGTGQTNINDQQTGTPLASATVSDPAAPSESLTVSLTQSDTTTGTLSNLGGFTANINNPGEYDFTGTAAQLTTALQGLVFTPTLHQVAPGSSVSTTFALSITDGVANANDANTVVQVTAANTAPTLSGVINPPAEVESPASFTGVEVSTFIAGQTSEVDTGQSIGIAITGVDNTNGTWEFSTNAGEHWSNIGTVSENSALLLDSASTTLIRFVPTPGFSGVVGDGLTFRAWNGFTGTTGTKVDVSTNGGSTAFSSGEFTASQVVNDAPVLSGANNLNNVGVNDVNNGGTLVSALIAGHASDADGDSLGIAITAVDTTDGSWQYSLDSGGSWTDFPTVSVSTALLLAGDGNTLVRFVPGANFSGTVPTAITFRAWDETTGTAGSTADTSISGGATAFSSATASSSVMVVPITITGTGPTNITDQQTTSPFASATVNDPSESSASLTVTLTLSSTSNGTLSNLGGFTEVGSTGVYDFTGTAAQATTALQGLLFTPTLHEVTPGSSVSTTFSLSITDGAAIATDSSTIVRVTATNTAPTLSDVNNLPGVRENPTTNNGITVTNLLAGQVSDPDFGQTIGIAITGVNDTNGDWQYSTDNGATWTDIGSPTDSTALLLSDNRNNRVRFAPNTNFSGLVSPGITVRAWDGSSGTSGSTADTTTNGGSTAFSSGEFSATVLVNNAPVLTGANNLTNINANDVNNGGTLVSALVAGKSTDANGDTIGIAVTFADTTNGSWQYSLDSGGSWTDFPTVSTTAALLLPGDANTLVRFVPGLNFSGTVSPALTFQAWDGATGTAGGTADATVDGGTTAFSTASASSSITVAPVISIAGTGTTNINDGQTTNPFASATVSNPAAPSDRLTVSITLSSGANGSLSNLDGFTKVSSTRYDFTGTAAQLTTALEGLLFTPTAHEVAPGGSVSTTFTLSVTDGPVNASDANTVVQVSATNTAPTLNGVNNLPPVLVNPVTDNGISIGNLIAGQVTDPDTGQTIGIAVTGVNDTNGDWQYSTNGGSSWTDIGTPTESAALLLANDGMTFVRFVPNTNFAGLVSPGITIRAWDGSTGTASSTADTSTNGGSTAFSLGEFSATVLVNNAPVLSGANNLNPIPENSTSPAPALVSDLLSGQASDANGNPLGIAITSVDDTHGTWEYSLGGVGGPWTDISGVSATNALLLPGTAAVRFVPTTGFFGVVSTGLTFQAWDGTVGAAGGAGDASINGGATAFSTASASSSITVIAPPTITGTNPNETTNDHTSISPFATVTIGDPNATAQNLVVTVIIGSPADGQFTTASLVGWTTVVAGSTYQFDGTALQATAAIDALVFVPTIHQVTPGNFVTTTFSIGAGNSVAPPVSDTSTSLKITALNDAPVLDPTQVQPLTTISELDNPILNPGSLDPGNTIASLLGTADTDVDLSPVQGIAITATSVTGFGSGVWQYSIDSGGTWQDIGTVSSSSALLLRSTDLVRFLPDTVNPNMGSITFLAWDQTGSTAGEQGTKHSTTVNGGSSPYSLATAPGTSTVTATPVNHAPKLTGTTVLMPVAESAGTVVAPLAGTDVDLPPQSLTYSITGGDPAGAYGITPSGARTADLTVANPGAIVYSPTPTVLTITATDNGNDPSPLTSAPATTTIELWQVNTSATLIGADSTTTLTVNLQFPVTTQSFRLDVSWGDGSTLSQTINPGVNTFTHLYATNPDAADPAASIPIGVQVSDSQSHVDSAPTAAPVPGTGLPGILVVPEKAPPSIIVAAPALPQAAVSTAAIEPAVTQPSDVGVATGEVATTTDRQLVLRIVNASGSEGANILMPDRLLDDLPDLFRRLPDGRYRVYLLEGGRERLVIDAVVRQGRPVDPSQESSGTADRPPTSQNEHAGSQRVAQAPRAADADGARPIAQQSDLAPGAVTVDQPAVNGAVSAPTGAVQNSPRTDGALQPLPAAPAAVPTTVPPSSNGSSAAPPLETPSATNDRAPRNGRHDSLALWTGAGAGVAGIAIAGDSVAARVDEAMSRLSRRSLSKAARLARRVRRASTNP